MRKNSGWALATVVSLAVAGIGSVSAADMAVKARPMPAPAVVTYNWTGCYVGGNVGGSAERTDQSRIGQVDGTLIVPPNDFGSSTGTAVVGGGQIGCDYQFSGNWVIGAEVMFDFGKISSQHSIPTAFPPFFPANAFSSTNAVKDVFTATARVGYLFAPSLLGYVKGGGAWAKEDHSIYLTVPVTSLSETAYGVTRQGWTVGGGLEWMFAPGWSVFGEFNYMDFGRKNISFVAAPGTFGTADVIRTRLLMDQFLFGVNYKFNFAQPVVAKY